MTKTGPFDPSMACLSELNLADTISSIIAEKGISSWFIGFLVVIRQSV